MEELLAGGNMDPVIRFGDTVRRVTGEWTPAVHALLGGIAAAGVSGVPGVLGIDEQGREILTFLPGDMLSESDGSVLWSDRTLTDAATLLRRVHDASVPFVSDGPWRLATHEPAEVVCHNDFAPYNLVVDGARLVGVIDFDTASPGPRIWDLAYLAYRIVPFAEDAAADHLDAATRDARLEMLIDAYGMDVEAVDVLVVAARRLDELAAFTDARAAETGRADLPCHAAMYRRDAARLCAQAEWRNRR